MVTSRRNGRLMSEYESRGPWRLENDWNFHFFQILGRVNCAETTQQIELFCKTHLLDRGNIMLQGPVLSRKYSCYFCRDCADCGFLSHITDFVDNATVESMLITASNGLSFCRWRLVPTAEGMRLPYRTHFTKRIVL